MDIDTLPTHFKSVCFPCFLSYAIFIIIVARFTTIDIKVWLRCQGFLMQIQHGQVRWIWSFQIMA